MTITNDAKMKENTSCGGRLVTSDGRTLPLRRMRLSAEAGGGLAGCRLEQTFANDGEEPLCVTYLLPLPADGAVSAFAFQIGERRITGEIDRREAARERFESALADGRSAALLEQDRSSLFTQEIGNIPPGAEIVAEISIDQPLSWLDEGSWEWRFPTTVAPRYLGREGRVEDAARVSVDVDEQGRAPRLDLALSIRDALADGREPNSPSHALHAQGGEGSCEVVLAAEEGARLDRDLVVRWPVARPEVGATLEVARPPAGSEPGAAYGLLTLVPPLADERRAVVGRDVIALIDTSGSMSGQPLDQARQVLSRIVETLDEHDTLELVEFSSQARRWKRGATAMTEARRRDALRWIDELRAGGATEMHQAIVEALQPLGDESQRQVILVTDGLIGFEQEIVGEILERLPSSSRVHTVGVGSAVNRTLTSGAARAGRGVEVVLSIDEDPAPMAARVVARTNAPLVVDLELSGSALEARAPERLPDLFAGAPARLGVMLRPEGGELLVRGRTDVGRWEQRLVVEPSRPEHGRREIVSHFGRQAIEDLEMRLAAGAVASEVDRRIEELGLAFQLATRLTSWVAVSDRADVDPTEPSRRERIPHELPHGLSVEGLGLRQPARMPRFAEADTFGGPVAAGPALDESGELLGAVPPRSSRRAKAAYRLPDDLLERPDAPAEPSALDAVRRVFRGFLGRPARGGRKEETPDGAPPGHRDFEGHVTLWRDGTLVIEFEVDGIDWELPEAIEARWSDGQVLAAELDLERTTRPGRVDAGRRIRLCLRLPDGAPDFAPSGLRLSGEAGEIRVLLS